MIIIAACHLRRYENSVVMKAVKQNEVKDREIEVLVLSCFEDRWKMGGVLFPDFPQEQKKLRAQPYSSLCVLRLVVVCLKTCIKF